MGKEEKEDQNILYSCNRQKINSILCGTIPPPQVPRVQISSAGSKGVTQQNECHSFIPRDSSRHSLFTAIWGKSYQKGNLTIVYNGKMPQTVPASTTVFILSYFFPPPPPPCTALPLSPLGKKRNKTPVDRHQYWKSLLCLS